ncbi:MAG: zf-HC2 domain-containing protein [Gemmatimonadaceae bacterium]|jgi:anti-sigma-K factor RskA
MTHDVIRHLLDDYVTGDLTEDARAPVADHVASCAVCSAEVDGLKRVLSRATQLPKSMDPPAEAWSNIRAAIQRDQAAVGSGPDRLRKPIWRRPVAVAAAAAIVTAVLSSTMTALYLGSRSPDSSQTTAVGNNSTAILASFTIEENNYLRTAAALQDVLDQQEASLAPETVAQLKASLRTIDEAILEARNALARDPSNKMLVEMLSGNYRQKVDLLRRSTEIARGT